MIDKILTCFAYGLWLLKNFLMILSVCLFIYIMYVLIAYILYKISHKRINLHLIVNNLINKFLNNLIKYKKSL